MKYPVFSSDSFTWKGKKGSAERSSCSFTGLRNANSPWETRAGFFVRSTKTDEVLFFTEVVDEDGYDGEMMVYSNGDLFITIFND